MSRTKRMGVGLIVLAALAGTGYYGWAEYQARRLPETDLILNGNVDVRQVTLGFRVSGRIKTVIHEEGDAVARGDVIATLEDDDFRDQVSLAQARVDASAAAVETLETGTREESIDQARAGVAQAEAGLVLARTQLDRQAELAQRDIASHQAHEMARAAYDQAAASLQAARAVLALAVSGPRSEDIRQARAALAAERSTLSIARRRLDDSVLKAPNEGIILSRVREPGSIVGPAEPIVTLSLSSPVWVRTYVDEPDLGRVAPGMIAQVRTDSGGSYSGQIGFISPVAEFTPKSVETRALRTNLVYRLRVIVQTPDNGLRQGMPVTVVLPLEGG